MSEIRIPTGDLCVWRRGLAEPVKQWKAGYSAMATAQSWEAARGLPPEVAAVLGPGARMVWGAPEYKVALPGGQRASQCDVFALAEAGGRRIALAVEAKVNETFGPTIGEWLAEAKESSGKRARLEAICGLLGCAAPPEELRYQLFHRSAAAVVMARELGAGVAAMVVQSFSPTHRWFDDFEAFCGFLGGEARRGEAAAGPLPGGGELWLGWAVGAAEFLREAPCCSRAGGCPVVAEERARLAAKSGAAG